MNSPKLRFKEFTDSYKKMKYKDVLKIKSGKDQKRIECKNGKYPILGTGGKIGTTNMFLYNKPSVLIGRKGTINKPQYMETPFWTVDTLFYSQIYKPNIPKYLFYSFQNVNWQKYDESTGVPSLSSSTIESVECFIPSIDEQIKVSNFLSLLDKKIELQTKKIEALKLFKKGLISKLLNEYNYEIMKIKDVLKFEQPTKYIVNSDDYINDSKAIPVLTANKAFILGYCNENNVYDKGDSIIFDDFTMDMKYTNFNYKIKSSAIKILTAKDNNDLRFLYELLLSLNLKSKEHKRHYISIVQEMNVKIPSIEVQNSISSKLELIDNKILFEEKFLDNLTKLKKGFMQNMFV